MTRDYKGRFTKRKWFLWLALIAVAFIALHVHFNSWYDKEIRYEAAIPVVYAGETMEAKVEEMKEGVLDTLAKCESGGKKEEDGITVLDSNNVGSYGVFQWQRKSYMHYYEIMTGNKINGRDAIIHAMTPEKARELARFVIFETKSGVATDWVNCSRKYKLQERVDFIKELTQ